MLKVLAETQVQGLQPGGVIYVVAVGAGEASTRQWQTALKLSAEMQVHGIRPNVTT